MTDYNRQLEDMESLSRRISDIEAQLLRLDMIRPMLQDSLGNLKEELKEKRASWVGIVGGSLSNSYGSKVAFDIESLPEVDTDIKAQLENFYKLKAKISSHFVTGKRSTITSSDLLLQIGSMDTRSDNEISKIVSPKNMSLVEFSYYALGQVTAWLEGNQNYTKEKISEFREDVKNLDSVKGKLSELLGDKRLKSIPRKHTLAPIINGQQTSNNYRS